MSHLKAKPAGGEPTGSGEKDGLNKNSTFDSTTLNPPLSNLMLTCRLAELQRQAESMMARDPQRYADHWMIWTSLQFKKCGWPWPGPGG